MIENTVVIGGASFVGACTGYGWPAIVVGAISGVSLIAYKKVFGKI